MSAVVVYMDDLMFLSRIRAAAAGQGVPVVSVRNVPDLVEACRRGARLVLVDLDARLPAIEAIAAVKTEESLADLPIVGFFSHVHPERGHEARAAGCTWALPRSAFVRQLEGLLRHPPVGIGKGLTPA
jgi:CheY-like chemotaxis protein